GYPLVPALFIVFAALLLVSTLISDPRDSLLGIALLLTALPAYLFARRKRAEQLVVGQHPRDRDRHVAERVLVHLGPVHRVHAIRGDDDSVVSRVRLERRAEHAGVGVHPGQDEGARA